MKTETRFFSRTCQEANAMFIMFIVLFRPLLAGTGVDFTQTYAFAKNVSITLSLTIFDFFFDFSIFSIVLSIVKIERSLSIFSDSFVVYSCSCHVLLAEAPRQISQAFMCSHLCTNSHSYIRYF